MELVVIRRLYGRDHLDQVLATFALILIANDGVSIVWGKVPLPVDVPSALAGTVTLGGFVYPAYRLVLIAAGLLAALGLYVLIARTRLGMLIRAGATHRETVAALGVDIARLNTVVFGLGALLAGVAGALLAPILAVQVGMGEQILILTFVAIVVGGLGSIRGAFVGALLVGLVDTLGPRVHPGAAQAGRAAGDRGLARRRAFRDRDLRADGGRAGLEAARPVPCRHSLARAAARRFCSRRSPCWSRCRHWPRCCTSRSGSTPSRAS